MTGREKLLKAAFRLFSEHGYDAVGIRQIGAAVGLTNPALYQHFSSKLALGEAVYAQCYAQAVAEVETELQPGQNPLENLAAYVRTCVRLHDEDPSPLLFLEDHQRLFGPKLRAHYGERAISVRLERWMVEGQNAGLIRTDVPAVFLVAMTIGQLTKWAVMADLGLAPRDQAERALTALLYSALHPASHLQDLPS